MGLGDDDLGAVLTKAVDESDAYHVSMNPTSNGIGTAGTPVTPPFAPATETTAA